jgi:RimJ/RimL family protein N-acetyltransferase
VWLGIRQHGTLLNDDTVAHAARGLQQRSTKRAVSYALRTGAYLTVSITGYAAHVKERRRIDWSSPVGHLTALEPTIDEVREHAAILAEGYNEPRNAELMGHTARIDPDEVVDLYAGMLSEDTRPFLLLRDGQLVGDGDLRGFDRGAAEFAFMIAAPNVQGKGLGTRFALMLAAFGFREAGLDIIYASVVPQNTASRRVFEKLGYLVDDSERARSYADEDDDIVMSIDRETFERANAAMIVELQLGPR